MRNIFKVRSLEQLKFFFSNIKMIDLIKEDFSKLRESVPFSHEKIQELKKFRENSLYVSELVDFEKWERERDNKKKILMDIIYYKNKYPNYTYISESTLNDISHKYNFHNTKTNLHNFKITPKVSSDLTFFKLDETDIHFYASYSTFGSYWTYGGTYGNQSFSLEHIKKNIGTFTPVNENSYIHNNYTYIREAMNILHSPIFNDYLIIQPVVRDFRRGYFIVSSSHEPSIVKNNNMTKDDSDDSISSLIAGIKIKRGRNISPNLTDEEIDELINTL